MPTLRSRRARAGLAIGVATTLGLTLGAPAGASTTSASSGSTATGSTTTSGTTTPTGPPAPPGFAASLITLYGQATAVVPSGDTIPTSPAQFATMVQGFTPTQLDQIYDDNPSGWAQAFSAVGQYAAQTPTIPPGVTSPSVSVPSTTTTATTAPSTPTTVPSSTSSTTVPPATTTTTVPSTTTTVPSTTTTTVPSTTTTVPSTTTTTEPRRTLSRGAATAAVVAGPVAKVADTPGAPTLTPAPIPAGPTPFDPQTCKASPSAIPALLQSQYALQVAQLAVNTAGNVASATFTLLADAALYDPVFLAQDVQDALAIAGQAVAVAIGLVATALQIPVDVLGGQINLAEDCQGDNQQNEISNIDGNEVSAEQNANTLYGQDQGNLSEDQYIQGLLDSRTATIISQVNTAQQSLDQALYHSIEEALVGGTNTAIVSYELPASEGGYLDATPIGVQAIVTSTLSLMQTAAQPFNPEATGDLTQANALLAAGNYKAAFAEYQTTYQLLVH